MRFSWKGSAIMDERIKEHLKYLNKYYLLLLEARKVPYDDFFDNPMHYGSTERFFHLAIESCLNIGNQIGIAININNKNFLTRVLAAVRVLQVIQLLAEKR